MDTPSINRNKESVELMKRGFIGAIKNHLMVHKIDSLEFKRKFLIWVEETYHDTTSKQPFYAHGIYTDYTQGILTDGEDKIMVIGTTDTEETELTLNGMDVEELAHIVDILENMSYKVLTNT